ncbi:MAG: hypothetical protein DVB31_14420 [Verrucomicrobia bacterium]|nr:MAG: hypothetical protein DVB31_14420 [Verrucomicrobiota bacterium]
MNTKKHSGNGPAHGTGWVMGLARSLAAALALALPVAVAGIPEPGIRLYGTVALDGAAITAADASVVVEARKSPSGPPIASYPMGSQPAAGNFYSLRINAESAAPLSDPNNVLLGSTLYVVVRDASGDRAQQKLVFDQRGLVARLNFGSPDTDGDGMSDDFETTYFGNATGGDPNGDPDHDGRPNFREFLDGTNPLVADGRHPADRSPSDDRITIAELTDYILAWKTGGTWPVEPALTAPNIEDYVTRAGAIWKGGETYVFDNDPSTNAPMWWVNPPAPGTPPVASALAVVRSLPAIYQPNQGVAVTLGVTPSDQTKAYAAVETPPTGWTVRNISHEGRWDDANHKIKWGPFFDQSSRTFTYETVPGPAASGPADFAGRGSFDGFGLAASGAVRMQPAVQAPPPRLVVVAGNGSVNLELHGQPNGNYDLQSSEDLVAWTGGQTVSVNAQGIAKVDVAQAAKPRFFRLRQLP